MRGRPPVPCPPLPLLMLRRPRIHQPSPWVPRPALQNKRLLSHLCPCGPAGLACRQGGCQDKRDHPAPTCRLRLRPPPGPSPCWPAGPPPWSLPPRWPALPSRGQWHLHWRRGVAASCLGCPRPRLPWPCSPHARQLRRSSLPTFLWLCQRRRPASSTEFLPRHQERRLPPGCARLLHGPAQAPSWGRAPLPRQLRYIHGSC